MEGKRREGKGQEGKKEERRGRVDKGPAPPFGNSWIRQCNVYALVKLSVFVEFVNSVCFFGCTMYFSVSSPEYCALQLHLLLLLVLLSSTMTHGLGHYCDCQNQLQSI